MVGTNLGLGADDSHIKLAQSRTELIGLIELLDDLMARLAQLCHCLLVHTVGNENTHDKISLSYFLKVTARNALPRRNVPFLY